MDITNRVSRTLSISAAALLAGAFAAPAFAQAPPQPTETPPPAEQSPTQRTTSPVVPPVNSAPAPAPVPRWVDGFSRADTDRNGSISREELSAHEKSGEYPFASIDSNADGMLSQQEWIAYDDAMPDDAGDDMSDQDE